MIDKTAFLGNLRTCLFNSGKLWWGYALALKILGFCMGVIAVALPNTSIAAVFAVSVLGIASEVCQEIADLRRGQAEMLHRKLELLDSLGWPITPTEILDLRADLPAWIINKAEETALEPPGFMSKEAIGTRRAIENVQESAWWSARLSNSMVWICSVTILVAVTTAIAALVLSLVATNDIATGRDIARIVMSMLVLVISLGTVRLVIRYRKFQMSCTAIVERTERLLSGGQIAQVDATKVIYEYQISRSGTPMLPTWLWKRREGKLNDLWREFTNERNLK